MNRVATFGNYQSALLSLMNAQNRAVQAQERIDSEKIATDMTGYGRSAESLTSLTSTQARLQSFITTGEAVLGRLTQQDLTMMRVQEAGVDARDAIANALAAGHIDNLMTDLGLQYQAVQGGLNGQHQGNYMFAGGRADVAPLTARTMAELAAAPSTASVFTNDQLKQKSRIDEKTTLETGFLADEIGGPLVDVFRSIQAYQNGNPVTFVDANGLATTYTPAAPGTLTGQPGADVEQFLKAAVQQFETANKGFVNQVAKNGLLHNHVSKALDTHESQVIALEKMMVDKTGYDVARAITDLHNAQLTIQASAEVINTLRGTSLLDILR